MKFLILWSLITILKINDKRTLIVSKLTIVFNVKHFAKNCNWKFYTSNYSRWFYSPIILQERGTKRRYEQGTQGGNVKGVLNDFLFLSDISSILHITLPAFVSFVSGIGHFYLWEPVFVVNSRLVSLFITSVLFLM